MTLRRLIGAGGVLAAALLCASLAAAQSLPNPNLGLSTKFNGTPVAPSAYTDTTNANNIASGTLGVARLPALTGGDATTSAGSGAITLNTVNSNVGSFGAASTVPIVTVDAKGRVTGVATATVVAPAGTLTGNTLASGVTGSSLTSLGTLSSLGVSGAVTFSTLNAAGEVCNSGSGVLSTASGGCPSVTISVAHGGTGAATLTAHGVVVGEGTSPVDVVTASGGAQLLLSQSSGDPAFETMSGDGVITALGALTVTKTNGVAFGALATLGVGNQLVSSGGNLNVSLGTLTFGTHLAAGGASYNGTGAVTISTDATSTNTASTMVARDASGNFAAGTITATLNGNAATATSATSATTATNATNVGTVAVSANASYYPLLAASTTNGNQAPDLASGLTFNPSTDTLTTTTVVAALTGHASLDVQVSTLGSGVNTALGNTTNASGGFIVAGTGGYVGAAQFPAVNGDLTGSAGSLSVTVAKINGATLGTTTATSGNLLIGSGSAWQTEPVSGDCTMASSGAITCTKTAGVALTSIATTSATNGITNGNLAQGGAATLKGNPTGATANEQDFAIQSLSNLSSPNATLDAIPIYDHVSGQIKYSTPGAIASSATAGVSTLNGLSGTVALTPTDGAVVNAASGTISLGAPGGLVNKFRNGAFDMWQRGTAATTIGASGSYFADGWKVSFTGSTSVTALQATGTGGALYALEVEGATSNTDIKIGQRVESYVAAPMAGKIVTVQFQYYQNTGSTVTPKVSTCYASTQDVFTTCTSDLASTGLTACATATWCLESYSFTASSSAGNGYEVDFDCNAAFTSSSSTCRVTAADIRVTPGATASAIPSYPPPPELRPIFAEQPFNERYFRKSYALNVAPGTTASTGSGSILVANYSSSAFITTIPMGHMRAAPSVTVYDQGGNAGDVSYYASSWSNGGTLSISVRGDSNLQLSGSISGAAFICFDYAATAEL